MVCRNQNCKAEFCWVCLGPWEPHGSAWWVCFTSYQCLFYILVEHWNNMYISHWLQVQLQSLQWRWCKGSQRCSRGTLGIIRPKICHPHVILYLSKETQISSCRKAWLFPVESKPWLVTVVLFGIMYFIHVTAISCSPAALPLLLQPLHEPHAESALRAQVIRAGEAEDGGDAAAQHVVDRGAVPEEGCGCAVPVSLHAHVHLRLCLLPQKEQPVHHFRGEGEIKFFFFLFVFVFLNCTTPFSRLFYSCKNNDYFWTGFQNTPPVCCWWD